MRLAALVLALPLLAAAGCGQKGPLTLPDEPRTAVPAARNGDPGDDSNKDKKPDTQPP